MRPTIIGSLAATFARGGSEGGLAPQTASILRRYHFRTGGSSFLSILRLRTHRLGSLSLAILIATVACETSVVDPLIPEEPLLARLPGLQCQPLPSWAPEGRYAPCGTTLLHQVGGPTTGAVDALVLVHGWIKSVDDWKSYYAAQGIPLCNLNFAICAPKPFPKLPGQVYFRDLIAQLQSDLPQVALYVFSYESFNHFKETGLALAEQLTLEHSARQFSRVILLGHSMGGLVARAAAATPQSTTVPLAGILALATPHLGTELPTDAWANFFYRGVPTVGGASLAETLPRNETTPLFLFGGDIRNSPAVDHWKFMAPYANLCNQFKHCNNDGAVPTGSARGVSRNPADRFNDPTIVRHRVYDGYDHSDMNGGKKPLLRDPLYGDVLADIRSLLLPAPPPPPPSVWLTRTPLSQGMTGIPVATVGGELFIFGGSWTNFSGPAFSPAVQSYDTATDVWVNHNAFPCSTGGGSCIAASSAQAVNGVIFLAGGRDFWSTIPYLRTFTPSTGLWGSEQDMPFNGTAIASGVVGTTMFVSLCSAAGSSLPLLAFDLVSRSWSQHPAPPHCHADGAGGAVGGKFYLVGGNDGIAESSDVHEYDPLTRVWARKAGLSGPRVLLAAVPLGNKLIVAGGFRTGSGDLAIVEMFDPLTNTWSGLPPMPTARRGLALGAVNRTIFAISGLLPNTLMFGTPVVESLTIP